MIEIFLGLDKIQQWFLIIFGTIIILSCASVVLYLLSKGGIKTKNYELKGIEKEAVKLPEYQKQNIWEKDITIKAEKFPHDDIKIGSIGFIKDIVIFKFFGTFWNSADPETKILYDKFAEQFVPPMWVDMPYRNQLEAFLFLENSNIQSKLLPIIREQAKLWKHIFVIGTWEQIQGQELSMLTAESNAPENIIVMTSPPTSLGRL